MKLMEFNILNLNIETEIFYSSNIQNNTLSLSGLSIYLAEKHSDEWDVGKIHKLLENKIVGKHIISIPYETEVEGILLEDLILLVSSSNINMTKFVSNKFILNVKFKGKKELEKMNEYNKKSTYGTINLDIKDNDYKDFMNKNGNDYDDYVDINDYF